MKKIILLIVSVWMCVSCGNLEEMNIDPDNATQTHPKLLLTQICMNAFKRGTDGMYATKKVIQADGESADQYSNGPAEVLATMTISAMYKRWVKRQNV